MFRQHRFSCYYQQCKQSRTKLNELFLIFSVLSILYYLAYTDDDGSLIYVVETSSFEIYSGFIFSPHVQQALFFLPMSNNKFN